MTKKKIIILIVIAVVAVAAIAIAAGCFYEVNENEYACVVRFSKIISVTDEAGLHFKAPFIDSIKTYPKQVLLYDINPSDVITKDKKSMMVDSYVLWQIGDPLTFVKTLGTLAEAESRLDVLAYNATKNKMSTLEQNDIINLDPPGERNDIYASIFDDVRDAAAEYGINVIDVKIKRFDLPETNEDAVYERMISERNRIAAKYTAEGELEAAKIINEVDKEYNTVISNAKVEAEKAVAEGEAEYMRILSEAYEDADKLEFYSFVRGLDALKASMTGQKTVILGKDSEIARLLMGDFIGSGSTDSAGNNDE